MLLAPVRFLFVTIMLIFWGVTAHALDMTEALAQAYQHNPALAAAQARLRAVDTRLAEAQSGWRPSADLALDGGIGHTRYDGINGGNNGTNYPRSATISVTQPVWRGGATTALTERAEAEIRAERARLVITEQTILLQAASSYLDTLRDDEIVKLERENVGRLQQQLEGSNKRFEAGELTVTDVRQAQARLAAAEANAATAAANLAVSQSDFQRVVGLPANNLAAPKLPISLPATLDSALNSSAGNDPQIAAANYNQDAARADIGATKAALRPDVALKLDLTRSWAGTDFANGGARVDDARLVGSIVVPLYRGGADYARLAGARETASARTYELQDIRNQSRAQTVAAWAGMQAAEASLKSRAQQSTAAAAALEGVQMENQVGTRSVLDVLDAQQEVRDARVGQAQNTRDLAVAQLQLMAAGGQLTARGLKLPAELYDPARHFHEIDGAWFAGQ